MARTISAVIFLVGIIAAYAVTNEFRYGRLTRVAILSAIAMMCSIIIVRQLRFTLTRRRLRMLRGIHEAGLETLPYAEISHIWGSAKSQMLAFGMGMSRLSKNEDLIRDTIRRGVKVRVVLIDPVWLSRRKSVVDQLSYFYDTQNIVGKNTDSYQRLCRLRKEIAADYGENALDIAVYRNVIMMSAAIADPGTVSASGFVEFHLFHGGDKRLCLKISNYADQDRQRSLLTQIVRAIELAVGNMSGKQAATSTDDEQV